jgi:cytoskeletal protein CcmA (bactofilin family)
VLWKRRTVPAVGQRGVNAIINEGTEIEGDIRLVGAAAVNGTLKGTIVADGTLIVGEKGVLNGSIETACLVIHGRVHGTVVAGTRVEVAATGHLDGDVLTPVLAIADGARFDGRCLMRDPRTPEAIADAYRPANGTAVVTRIDLHHSRTPA